MSDVDIATINEIVARWSDPTARPLGYIIYESWDFEGSWPIDNNVYLRREAAEAVINGLARSKKQSFLGYSIEEVEIVL